MQDGYKPLKLYIDKNNLSKNIAYSPFLFPFFGVDIKPNAPFTLATFNKLGFDTKYYDLVDDIGDADYVFLPHGYWGLLKNDSKLIDFYKELSKKHNKPILIDAVGDIMDEIKIPNSVILRLAQYKGRMSENQIIVPCYIEDLLDVYYGRDMQMRERKEKASIGFSGWTHLDFWKFPKTYIKNLPINIFSKIFPKYKIYRKGIFLRDEVTEAMEKSKSIYTNFIKRSSFSGNVKTAEDDMNEIRSNFVSNIIDNDYSLCVRGDANASTRFYEILSLGRIPFFVDTECVLPLEDKINYKEFCVFVDYKKMDNFGDELHTFHKNISPEEFKNMQIKAREAFEEYLRIDVFTKYLMNKLREYKT